MSDAGVDRVRTEVQALRAYRLAHPAGAVRLHQNEAPDDWPEAVKREIVERLLVEPWHRYPSTRAEAVASALGRLQGTPPEDVVAASGSSMALWSAFAAIASGGTVVMSVPTFTMARTLAVIAGARVVEVPLGPAFGLDADAVLRAAHAHRAEAIYLASPNNPTGNALAPEAVEAVLEGAPGAVVLDEAYWEFAAATSLPLVARFPHLVLVRTFSKAMAGAGLRVGWSTAQPQVAAELAKATPPYNLNAFAQVAVPVMVAHRDAAAARVKTVRAERERLVRAMTAAGVRVFPSETNFLLFAPGPPPGVVWQGLADRGVLVRDVSTAPLLGDCLRVSVGTRADNDRFLEALAAVMAEHRAA